MSVRLANRGIIEILYNDGVLLRHYYRSIKELKEFKNGGEVVSYKIIKPLIRN